MTLSAHTWNPPRAVISLWSSANHRGRPFLGFGGEGPKSRPRRSAVGGSCFVPLALAEPPIRHFFVDS